jgi:hypothetical protein
MSVDRSARLQSGDPETHLGRAARLVYNGVPGVPDASVPKLGRDLEDEIAALLDDVIGHQTAPLHLHVTNVLAFAIVVMTPLI